MIVISRAAAARRLTGGLVGAVFTAMLALPAQAATQVDLELQLLVSSGSTINATEFAQQRQHYVDAFNDPQLQAAILDTSGGRIGAIAVQFVYFSSGSDQSIAVDWTLIDSAAAAGAFATAIAGVERTLSSQTHPAYAINFGTPLFDSNDFDAPTQIINLSADNQGVGPSVTSNARDAALAAGIDRINVVAVESSPGVADWYSANAAGGADAFVLAASGFGSYGDQLDRALLAAVRGTAIDLPLPAPAALLLAGLAGLAFAGRRRRG
ncbi:hypothetical protein LNKW23_21160 [Paralimibaculum aggregatum]|uniref:Secreted protein n=1 Tax=Paralimibaculum aggregatum TaxID=3036245 RepID=A0ABQ6LNU5_9RHOB|nr:DUF1194 domain-containing protein [Limibaculum sp. NKW23]GMG82903.1 hypothetical protein LNKW23_21160 [Limibaculum sp. NKW23]